MEVTVFNAKNYDMACLKTAWKERCENKGYQEDDLKFRFVSDRLNADTVDLATGSSAISCFVNCTLDAPILQRLKEIGVKGIALRCAGFDQCDVKEAERLGLRVARVPAYSPNAVAEYAWALILYVCRKVGRSQFRTMEFNFALDSFLVGSELCGKTLGVIGTGKIGALVANYGNAFGMKVVCYDVFKNKDLEGKAEYLEAFEDVLKVSDVISLHVPLLASTRHMINSKTVKLMKPTAYLVNTSRGGLVDTVAIVEALKSNTIGGVGLDVVDGEDEFAFEDKSPTNIKNDALARLVSYRNSIVTAHQAFFTDVALGNIANTTVDNLLALRTIVKGAGSDAYPGANLLTKELSPADLADDGKDSKTKEGQVDAQGKPILPVTRRTEARS